ncbi:lipase family protein [Thalassotalea sp. M1531]|uniref:Lipase family protein n=1 Tax=Thalassotalea algicola TaxID=2716224 RepID=A0A7Y0Q670_9GAMM|nr:lipase family protein [Thalassotalea algicola]NMP30876.1 lipase family protein [Thalassotalea algicola]
MDLSQYSFSLSSTNEYNDTNALSLALACELAYREESEIRDIASQWQYNKVEFISVNKGQDIDTQCFVMSNQEHIVVSFRGSHSVKDWLANFQAVREPGPLSETLAHEGFQDALFPAIIKLTNTIDAFEHQNKKVWLTGHSLGGALSSLYAAMLCENGYEVFGLYSFASPRPGDERFANELNAQIAGPHYRVVNDGDIVPHVPPEPFFSHAGQRHLLEDEYGDHSDESWFTQRIKALKVFSQKMANTFDVVDNHTLTGDENSYIPKLERNVTGTSS